MVVSGPVGCGKTAVLRHVADRAVVLGGQFFAATAARSERHDRLGLIHQLTQAMRAAGVDGSRLDAAARAGDDAHLGWLQAFDRAVSELAGDRPVVIGVDDVHFADEQSLRCLIYLIRRIEHAPVIVVLTESSAHEGELSGLHAETLHLAYCHRVMPAPLTAAGVAEVLAERLGDKPDDEVTALCAGASGGSPLLLDALIEDYKAREAVPGSPVPGPWFRHAVLRVLHRSTPEMLAVARAAAVLGDSATPALIGDIVGADATTVGWATLGLQAAGLLSGLSFRHDVARLAALADVSARDLPEMHHRAAELLHDNGAPAITVADLLIAAHEREWASWPVAILREAAREAVVAGRVMHAVRYLRHAAARSTDPVELAKVTAMLADAQWHLDPATAARYLPEMSRDVRTRLLTGTEALVPVRQLVWQGDFTQAHALLLAVEADAGRAQAPAANRWWTAFARTGLGLGHADAGAATLWSGPVAALAPPPTLANCAGTGGWLSVAARALGVSPGGPLTPALVALLMLALDRPADAVRWSDGRLGADWATLTPMRRAVGKTVESAAELHRGRTGAAAAAARDALETITPAGWGVALGVPLAVLIRTAIDAGDLHTAASYVEMPVPAAMLETPFALPYLYAVGLYHLAGGRPHLAQDRFRLCDALAARWRLDLPDEAVWRDDPAVPSWGAIVRKPAEPRSRPRGVRARRWRGLSGERPVREVPARLEGVRGPVAHETAEDGLSSLTDAERRVAALAAAGTTNRQIADTLFITVSTVEQHLTQIYRKLNVRRRSDLPAALLRDPG